METHQRNSQSKEFLSCHPPRTSQGGSGATPVGLEAAEVPPPPTEEWSSCCCKLGLPCPRRRSWSSRRQQEVGGRMGADAQASDRPVDLLANGRDVGKN